MLRDAFERNSVHLYQRVISVRHAAHRGHTWLMRRKAQPAVLLIRSCVWVDRRRSSSTSSAAASVPGFSSKFGSVGDGDNCVIATDDNVDCQNKVDPATTAINAFDNNHNSAAATAVRLSEDAADPVREPGTQVLKVLVLEPCPKQKAVWENLAKIPTDFATGCAAPNLCRMLIVVRDPRTVDELTAVLRYGDDDS